MKKDAQYILLGIFSLLRAAVIFGTITVVSKWSNGRGVELG